jgi:probable HAF family extracellular repeat protein
MRFFSWLHDRTPRKKPLRSRPHVEVLEDRWCPSASYSVTDLGTLGGADSQANAINSIGQVVGSAQIANGTYHPFLYSGGVMTDLAPGFATDSVAWAINSSGQVAVSEGVRGSVNSVAFLWQSSSGLTPPLGNLGGSATLPYGINNATSAHPVQVVGMGTPAGGGGHAWLWQSSTGITDLNTLLPANSGWLLTEADGINDSQQIVGVGMINGQNHAYRWQIQQVAGSPVGVGMPTDLGTLPAGAPSEARAINQTGLVAGESKVPPPNQDHAVLWSSTGSPGDLGALPNDVWSAAYALNNASQVQVVGYSVGGLHSAGHAVLWQNGTIIDLNSQIPKRSSWAALETAYGINDAGQIVGQGQISSGPIWHAFMLTPTSGKALMAALPAHAVSQTLTAAQATPFLAEPIHVLDAGSGMSQSAAAPAVSAGSLFSPALRNNGEDVLIGGDVDDMTLDIHGIGNPDLLTALINGTGRNTSHATSSVRVVNL